MAQTRKRSRLPRKTRRVGRKPSASVPRYRAPTTIARVVRSVVRRAGETKYVSEGIRQLNGASTLATWGGFSSAITGVGEIYGAIPRVRQGEDDHERIGNQISPRSCRIKLDVCVKVYNDQGSRDRTVHIFLLTAKSVKSLDNYTSIPISQLLDKGDGTKVGFDGTCFTAQYPVNTSEFTVLRHIKTRMVNGYGLANSSTSASVTTTDAVISPSRQYAHIDFKVKVPQTFKYDRASQVYPTNSAPFIVIGFTNNNTYTTTAPLDYVQVLGQTQMTYKDS